jgi:hypothetical protein
MTRITVDAEMRKKLLNLSVPLELCDEGGWVLARLTPSTPDNDPDNWEELTPPVSDEEIQREIDSNEPMFTTEELIERIKQM